MLHLRGRASDVVVDLSTGAPVIALLGRTDRRRGRDRQCDPVSPGRARRARRRRTRVGRAGARRRATPDALVCSAAAPPGGTGRRVSRPTRTCTTATRSPCAPSTTSPGSCSMCRSSSTGRSPSGPSSPTRGTGRYLLSGLTVTLPLPQHADELCTFTGRWARELHPVARGVATRRVHQREPPWAHVARAPAACCSPAPPDSTSGPARCGASTSPGAATTRLLAERLPDGRRVIQAGELLHPGEVALERRATRTARRRSSPSTAITG